MNFNATQKRFFNEITAGLGIDLDSGNQLEVMQSDAFIDSPVAAHDFAVAALGVFGLATAKIGEMRGLGPQTARIDRRHAGLLLHSIGFAFQEGWQLDISAAYAPINNFFRTRDDRQIMYNGAYPHLRDGVLEFLGCTADYDAIAEATRTYDAIVLENQLADLGLCAAVARSSDEWLSHPQGQSLAGVPVIELTKLSDGDAVPLPEDCARPLESIRVLEFARVLAGPSIGRNLAEQGADVIHGRHPYLDHIFPFEIEAAWGKKMAYLDYNHKGDLEIIHRLLNSADIVVDGFRHGAMDRAGLSVEKLVHCNRNLILVQSNCYGFQGPWARRRGWEQLAQSCTGQARLHSQPLDKLELVPAFLNDYGTGLLGAIGAMAALIRRSIEGGSWLVRVSLARTSMMGAWLRDLREPVAPLTQDDLENSLVDQDTPFGLLTRVGPVIEFDRTPSMFSRPASPPGSSTLSVDWERETIRKTRVPHRPTQIFRRREVHWKLKPTG